jgi:hypothetical protein
MAHRFRWVQVQLLLAAQAALEGFSLVGRAPVYRKETVISRLGDCLFLYNITCPFVHGTSRKCPSALLTTACSFHNIG